MLEIHFRAGPFGKSAVHCFVRGAGTQNGCANNGQPRITYLLAGVCIFLWCQRQVAYWACGHSTAGTTVTTYYTRTAPPRWLVAGVGVGVGWRCVLYTHISTYVFFYLHTSAAFLCVSTCVAAATSPFLFIFVLSPNAAAVVRFWLQSKSHEAFRTKRQFQCRRRLKNPSPYGCCFSTNTNTRT